MDWLLDNKEWLFGGIGVVIVGAIGSILKTWYARRHRVRVLMHRAYFDESIQPYIFIKVTNLSRDKGIEITHVWLESIPKTHLMRNERPLPARLRPLQTWETWVEETSIPTQYRKSPFELDRVRLSGGETFKSKENVTVPERGYVAGQSQQQQQEKGHPLNRKKDTHFVC
ncbi:hypothetical protein [Candidatus Thiosymbion oneisti]|uniref:hypothetical protein n=1 Tax=Candidatus Thiosymbion oneisti TaxID=589554 RepID=UPI0013FD4683|nr:hypothetical protein [Candidatus Thiosymbion oneisti]